MGSLRGGRPACLARPPLERQLDGARQSHPPDEGFAGAVGAAAHNPGQRVGAAVDLDLEDEASISVSGHRPSLPLRHDVRIGRDRLIFSERSAEDRWQNLGIPQAKDQPLLPMCCGGRQGTICTMRVPILTRIRALAARIVVLAAVGAAFAIAPGSALATLWVSASGTDTGYCSQANPCATLSRAVSLAIPDDTIYIGPGRFQDHVTVPASITGLVLQGAGMHATTVDGGFDGSGSVFTIEANTTVTINDMSITGGQAPNGGGINSEGVLTLERDEIALNIATGSPPVPGSGGGVYSASATRGAGLNVSDSAILSNKAIGG